MQPYTLVPLNIGDDASGWIVQVNGEEVGTIWQHVKGYCQAKHADTPNFWLSFDNWDDAVKWVAGVED